LKAYFENFPENNIIIFFENQVYFDKSFELQAYIKKNASSPSAKGWLHLGSHFTISIKNLEFDSVMSNKKRGHNWTATITN
jgi:hypothetical protein